MKLERLRFTIVMLVLLIGLGIYGRTHLGELDPEIQENAGFSTRLLLDGHLHRILTSVFFTAGGWRFYSSLLMFAGAVGYVEWTYGSRRVLATFFGVHLATLPLLSLVIILPLSVLGTDHGNLLLVARDVGPSAGYYGCLGLALGCMTGRKSRNAVLVIGTILVVRMAWSALYLPEQGRTLSADLAHLIAFPIGLRMHALVGPPTPVRIGSK